MKNFMLLIRWVPCFWGHDVSFFVQSVAQKVLHVPVDETGAHASVNV